MKEKYTTGGDFFKHRKAWGNLGVSDTANNLQQHIKISKLLHL